MRADLHQPAGAIAQADQVAVVVEHAELDLGSTSGSGRDEADPAARERFEQRDVDAGLAELGQVQVAADTAMVDGDMIMSPNAPPGRPELYLTQQLVCRAWTSVGLSSGRSLSSMRTKG